MRAIAVLAVFTILGFFVLPPIVKSVVLDKLSMALHRPVSIRSVSINPYALTLKVEGLSIREREGSETFLSFDSLFVNVESSSLFKGGVVLGEIRLSNPKLRIVRLDDKRYNFSDLVDEFMGQPKAPDSGPPTLFSLNNIQISGGAVEFEDQPMRARHAVSDIRLTLPFVSNMAYAVQSFVEPSFSVEINGAPLSIKGKSKPFADSLESEVVLDLGDLQLPRYFEYLPVELPVKLLSGALDTDLKLTFRQEKGKSPSLQVTGKAVVRNVDVKDGEGNALIAFKELEVTVGSADLVARRFEIERVALTSPEISAHVYRRGVLNWTTVSPREKGPAQAPAIAAGQVEPAKPVEWSVGEFAMSGATLRLIDDSRKEPVKGTVEAMDLVLRKLESTGTVPAELETRFRINRRGEVRIDGTIIQKPLKADLNVDVKTLELLPLQPYFSEQLNIAVTRGQLTMRGAVQLRQPENAAPDGSQGLAGTFTGQATLGDFQSVDKINSADFLRWKSFYLGKVELNLNPLSVSIGEIALSDFFARIIVSPEGKLNLLQIVRNDENTAQTLAETPQAKPAADAGQSVAAAPAATSVPAESKPVTPVRIGKIILQGGNVRFTDNFVKPNYSANLKQVGGRIEGLSSEPGSVATLDLRGSYDDVAPLSISAKINPLSAKPYLDLQAEIKGVEMTTFSPYSGKYAGYAIEKGKLSLFVKYKIENDQLQAENRLFLDQLTFGEKVESPDATRLPVNLALSLLKNRRGEIDLELPISGSLNDPQFSVGGLVVKVIVNLLVKAVTSPFALLGSLFGSGEEMSNIEFNFGRAAITPVAEKRLENLSKALLDRPALRLEISGQVDAENDPEGLKRARIDRKVRAAKREDMTRSGVESGSAETIEVSSEEYPALLERVYKAEKFPKPRNMVGLVKSLPVEEMEKLMLANSTVDDEDLRNLGDRRAKAVRDWLLAREIPTERVFLLPSKLGEKESKPESDQKFKGSRADFSLR